MYCPWWECIDEDGSMSFHSYDEDGSMSFHSYDEDGSMSCHWYIMQRWRWIDVVSLVYDALLDKCIDESLLSYHDW